jgi:hypothetical protein
MLRRIDRLSQEIRGWKRDDRGMGMITVIGAVSVMAIITTVLTVQSLNNLGQASSERLWEMSLHTADSGVDHALYKLRTSSGSWNTGETLPGAFGEQTEREWVLAAADSAPADRVVSTAEGDWVVVKPSNSDVIYGVGYVPSKANTEKIRVVRAAYDFAPHIPTTAVLTNGNLTISGNPDVLGISGNVHSNSNITVSGNPSVSGYISASGTLSGVGPGDVGDWANTGGGKPPIEVPSIDPRGNYSMSEYDLCPDGRVRTGPSYSAGSEAPNATGIPCQGTQLAIATGSDYRGWKRSGTDSSQGAKWDYSGNTANSGVYYVYQGSAKISGNPGSATNPWRLSVMAEATLGSGCSRIGGDIEVSGNPYILYHDKAQPIVFLAGRDLKVSGNPAAGAHTYEGFLGAAEQFDISGNPGIGGTIVSENVCQTSGSIVPGSSTISGNPGVTYSGLEVPLGNNIRTTLWLEI